MKKYLIVGGVAGGMSTAARLRRLDEKAVIIVFEKGEYVSYANCGLPYYIGGAISDNNALLLQTPESFHGRFEVDVRINSEVTAINRDEKKIKIKNIKTGIEYEEKKQWDFQMKQYNDAVSLEKQRINAIKEIAVAYYKSQPKTVNYLYIIR